MFEPELPQFASTPHEIRLAVERNAIDRGLLFIRLIISFGIEDVLDQVDELAENYEKEDFQRWAEDIGIKQEALKCLDSADMPYPYYFCSPSTLIEYPSLVFYYRNVAMLSNKVMNGVHLSTGSYEEGVTAPSEEVAEELASYFNDIISDLILECDVTRYRHIVMMVSNLGDSLGGSSRNEVGRVAMVRVISPLIRHLHAEERLSGIEYRLKGRIAEGGEVEGEESRRWKYVTADTDIEELLDRFEEYRVWYYTLETKNGSSLLLNRQLTWHDNESGNHHIGPDLHSQVGDVDMLWAAELKGGADPAGSDEHWKTATEALDRILRAAEATSRPQPKLSFIATILVDRVARAAQTWIDEGKLTSVYNLTQMYHTREEEMERFLRDMTGFMGYEKEEDAAQ